jgi:hypothetical protein
LDFNNLQHASQQIKGREQMTAEEVVSREIDHGEESWSGVGA